MVCCREIHQRDRERIARNVDQATVEQQRPQVPSHPAVAHPVGRQVQHSPRQLTVGRVDEQSVKIRLGSHQVAAGPDDPHQFGQRIPGLLQVMEQALGVARIEARVWPGELVDVPLLQRAG